MQINIDVELEFLKVVMRTLVKDKFKNDEEKERWIEKKKISFGVDTFEAQV